MNPYLQIGYLSRAHGLRGELALRTFDPASSALEQATLLRLRLKSGEEKDLSIEGFRPADKELLLTLAGIASRTEAESLVGAAVFVLRTELPEPAEGEFFQGDLVGLAVFDEAGAPLGTVEEVWNTGPVVNLVIRREGFEELIVPFADDFVPTVDLQGGRLVVRPPEYT